ncbi:MAG: competence/damage-inducible protein A [Thermoleophilaceae bacterium]
MSVRAGIVVTGTEVLSGRVRDRNGPWLADRLLELGVELAHVTICGDRPEDMEAQLRFMADEGVELMITSGGLGPTADDLTAEVVGRFQGRPLRLDEDLEQRIADIVAPLARRWRNVDPEAMRLGTRKQAMVPEGAAVLEPAGTAPGLVVAPANGSAPTVVVLPGPPRELHEMWAAAVRSEPFTAAIGNRTLYEQRMLRMFGIPESEIAETLRVAESEVADMERLEITTCLRRGEVEMVTRYEPGVGDEAWRGLEDVVRRRHSDTLFSTDGSSVDDQVAELLAGRRLAVAESCTGGLMAARLTERPGSSEYVVGGIVSYADEAKTELVGVDPALIERHGAVSTEVAEAMADGALARLEADVAVAITGVAGPGEVARRSPSARSAGRCARPRAPRSPARFTCPGTAATCATARRRWGCTCCGACCAVRTLRSERRRTRPPPPVPRARSPR